MKISHQISDEENEAFCHWAFGDKGITFSEYYPNTETMEAWNRRHGELLKIKGDDLIVDSLKKMWEIWKQQIEKERSSESK